MVHGPSWELPRVLMESLGRILNIEGGPSIFSLGTPLSTLGNLHRGSIHNDTPSAFSQIIPDMSHQITIPDNLFWFDVSYTIKLVYG